jgi:raffinose/stachyose/melibiose transport system substrate-binding protein
MVGSPRGRNAIHRLTLRVCFVVAAVACLLIAASASDARPDRRSDTVTISLTANNVGEKGYEAIIANFQRVYPGIKVAPTYVANTDLLYAQLTIQLAAGTASDAFVTYPGCGTRISVCKLAHAGYLAPMVNKPWAKRSVPIVTSLDKVGKGLYAFTPIVSLYGVFTNDDLFKSLNLKVPQTYAQLLDICRKAKAAGKAAIILPGTSKVDVTSLLTGMAVPLVYAKDKKFLSKQRAGKMTFAASAGWRKTLQEFVEMNSTGCFQQGAPGTSQNAAIARFQHGDGLMYPAITNMKGLIEGPTPQFSISHHLFPGGTKASETRTYLHLSLSPAVNVHASAEKQKAAQTFVDFFARPKQNALFAQIQGGMTQDQFRKRQVPPFMSSEASAVKNGAYVISPVETWWNAGVVDDMQTNQIGLLTGQRSVEDVLKGMDAAWKSGPD